MAESLKGFTAFITGGSSGLGFEMAKQLLSQGATVIIAARAGERMERAKEALSVYDGFRAAAMDVMDEESVKEAAGWVEENFGRLDMVVSNAGIGRAAPGMRGLPENARFYDIPVSTVQIVVGTNLIGHFTVAKYFVPLMLKQGRGSLIYVSTGEATMTRAGQIPYGPSKAGAEAMCAVMEKELRGTGITVNVITPGGFTDTNLSGEGDLERHRKNNLPVLPPTVLNRTISFLASPQAAGISGEKLVGKDIDVWLESRGIRFED